MRLFQAHCGIPHLWNFNRQITLEFMSSQSETFMCHEIVYVEMGCFLSTWIAFVSNQHAAASVDRSPVS